MERLAVPPWIEINSCLNYIEVDSFLKTNEFNADETVSTHSCEYVFAVMAMHVRLEVTMGLVF